MKEDIKTRFFDSLYRKKNTIVLCITVGSVLRGIFSQTLCRFKARCEAPSTENATTLRLHPTWDNLNSCKFPSWRVGPPRNTAVWTVAEQEGESADRK